MYRLNIHLEEKFIHGQVHTLCGIHINNHHKKIIWAKTGETSFYFPEYYNIYWRSYFHEVITCERCLELLPLYEIKNSL